MAIVNKREMTVITCGGGNRKILRMEVCSFWVLCARPRREKVILAGTLLLLVAGYYHLWISICNNRGCADSEWDIIWRYCQFKLLTIFRWEISGHSFLFTIELNMNAKYTIFYNFVCFKLNVNVQHLRNWAKNENNPAIFILFIFHCAIAYMMQPTTMSILQEQHTCLCIYVAKKSALCNKIWEKKIKNGNYILAPHITVSAAKITTFCLYLSRKRAPIATRKSKF